jgi:hypothetical protein
MTKPCPPPDPSPRKPRLALPRGATDCHFHVYGPAERYPMLANRDHTTPDASPRSARHLFETLGVERAPISTSQAPLPAIRAQKPKWKEAAELAREWNLTKLAERLLELSSGRTS